MKIIDTHNDLPGALRKKCGYSVDELDQFRPELQTDIGRLRSGDVGAQFWSVWVPSDMAEPDAVVATMEQVDAVYRLVAKYPDDLAMAFTADDAEKMMRGGRIASLLGIEGGHSINESLGALRTFARLGVRYMTLTHNDDTSWAASGTGLRQHTGLSAMGKAIVAEMNRIGMMVDLSHTAESTQNAALDCAQAPLIFSHSSMRSVTDHPRNVSDEVLERLVANQGVVQITFVPSFVSQACADWQVASNAKRAELKLGIAEGSPEAELVYSFAKAAPRPGESARDAKSRNESLLPYDTVPRGREEAGAAYASWMENNPKPQATLADVADHCDHARDVVGINHVGIGGDFDGTPTLPVGLEDVSTYPALLEELRRRRWSLADTQKLASENFLRVMRAVEDAASALILPERVRDAISSLNLMGTSSS